MLLRLVSIYTKLPLLQDQTSPGSEVKSRMKDQEYDKVLHDQGYLTPREAGIAKHTSTLD